MKKKNGFTLVELLAILIILGIIALITVPIISKTLKDARINTAIDSSYGYIRAVDKLYYSKSLNDEDVVEDGIYTVSELKTLGVSVDGREPLEGWVELEESEVVAFSIKIGDYVVTKYRDSEIVCEKGEVQPDEVTSKKMEISAKVDSYVKAALAANSSLTSETALLVSEISGVTTNVPDTGWIHFNVSSNTVSVVDYSLTYGNITANYSSLTNGNYVSTFGDARNKPTILVGTVKSDGAKYLTTVQEVYYNPTTGQKCSSSESVSTTGTVTGCMHWYLYSVKGDYANMLLDHNITDYESANAKWAYSDTYNDLSASSAGITYPGVDTIPEWSSSHNSRGPVTALNTLKSLTTNWKTQTPKVPNSTSTNEYIITKDKNDNKYQIDYTGYKARLITKEEAGYLGCTLGFKLGFTGVISSCREWMIKSTYGENSTSYEKIIGYWTSSPVDGNSSSAWTVYYDRYMMSVDAIDTSDNHSYFGIRPVITVKITDVLSQS